MLDIFQSRVPVAVLAFEKLEELQMYFATHEQSNNAFEQHLTTAEDVPYEQKQVVIATVKHAVGNCQEKLSTRYVPNDSSLDNLLLFYGHFSAMY